MFFRQLKLLLWKNFIIRIRHPLRTLTEIVWPILLFTILVIIRLHYPVENATECHYPARALPSAGVLPWMETMFCNLDNPCFNVPVPSETPGQINEPTTNNKGLLAGLRHVLDVVDTETDIFKNPERIKQDMIVIQSMIEEITKPDSSVQATISSLMSNPTSVKSSLINAGLSSDLADTILQSTVTYYQVSTFSNNEDKFQIACDESAFANTLTIPPTAPLSVSEASKQLCNLTNDQFNEVWNVLVGGIDLQQFFENEGTAVLTQAGTNSGLNPTDLFLFVSFRVPELQKEFLSVITAAMPMLQSLSSSSNNTLNNVVGYNILSLEGFQKFCGHPEPRVQFGQKFVADLFSVISPIVDAPRDEFCKKFVDEFENNDDLVFVWSVLKPILFGKVPYTPDTNVTRDIMARSNATFSAIGQMQTLTTMWADTIGPAIYDYLQNSQNVELLRTVLEANFSQSFINISESQLDTLRIFLSNNETSSVNGTFTWKMVFEQLNFGVLLINKILSCTNLDKFEGFETEALLVDRALELLDNNSFWAGIVFLSPTADDVTLPKHISYKIRQDVDDVMRTDFIRSYNWEPGANTGRDYVRYLIYGFADMQDMMEHGIARAAADAFSDSTATIEYYGAVPKLGYYLQQMPYPCHTIDTFLLYLGDMMSLLMTLAWIYSVCIMIKNMVYEKEERLKEFMKMMGLGNGVHWLAWFINSFYLMVLSCILMVIVLSTGKIMPYSNPLILFFWLISFCLATIGQCFLISCFFSKANLAAASGGIIYFLLYIPYNFAISWEDQLELGGKVGLSLFSTVAFGYGVNFIAKFEMSGDGVQTYNWNTSPNPNDQYTFFLSLMMMLVDAIIYFILTWYIENVYPGRYGIPRPFYFMFTSSYWCGTPTKPPKQFKGNSNPTADEYEGGAKLEEEPKHLPLGVSIQNLTKIYRNGDKVAVDDLSLNFYEGQITSFLGHNGAGKTTTMSILCGLYTPTHGTAYIHGNDIRTDIDTIRSSLGMCPQHNVLFRDLTVEEHLYFYGSLRDKDDYMIKKGTEQMLLDVDLPHKRDVVIHKLSGGMKRKLSVAISFIGDSKTIILDEPTAGVDPYARRGIWDLMLKYRAGRTIILSTHHMDEADLLGDRIAIISQGRLKCCGSSLFLKSKFGSGYYLTLVKQKLDRNKQHKNDAAVLNLPSLSALATESDEGFASQAASSKSSVAGDNTYENVDDIGLLTEKEAKKLIHKMVPDARIHEENSGEITFILPYEAIEHGSYANLFQLLDDNDIGYGLTDTSLEEIFLSVADHIEETPKSKKSCWKWMSRKRERLGSGSISPNVSPRRESTQVEEDIGSVQLEKVRATPNEYDVSHVTTDTAVQVDVNEVYQEMLEDSQSITGDHDSGKGSYQIRGGRLILQQFTALLVKRFHHARRNRKGLVAQILLPSIFVLIALCLSLILPPYQGQQSLQLHPWLYGDNQYTFTSNDNPANPDTTSVNDALINSPGLGTRCMDGYKILRQVGYEDSIRSIEESYLNCINETDNSWQTDDKIKSKSQLLNATDFAECSCTSDDDRVLLAECPLGADGPATPYVHADTTDYIYNMTGRNVADWLVKTTDRYIEKRYGGLSVGEHYYPSYDPENMEKLLELLRTLDVIAPGDQSASIFLENMWRTENGKIWFDNNAFHGMPAWMNVLSNGMLRSQLTDDDNVSEFGISVFNHPMNFTQNQIEQASLAQMATDTAIAIVVVFAMSFVPASFVVFLIDERVSKSKHLQFISGVNRTVYWIANYLWDMINYLIPAIIVVIIFLGFQTEAYVSSDNLPCLVLLLLLYGWAITPMMYPFSFVFEVSSTAYVVLTCINLFIGINTSIATLILQLLQDDEDLQRVNEILKKVFLIFPHYCLGRGLIDMAINQAYADATSKFGVDSFVNPLEWDAVGKNLVAMAISGFVFFLFNLLIQYRFFIRPGVRTIDPRLVVTEVDENDVVAEKQRVLRPGPSSNADILRLTNLSKVYNKGAFGQGLLAVDRMCVGVSPGECFGLLGVNGAGKTTTFKMLTGDEMATSGDATVCGTSINQDIRTVQQNTGYCPQFDAINDHLTGYEHLQLYARLRGVPKDEVDTVAAWGIDKLDLQQYAHKEAGTYSGGNKRKLSAAIAFIGCPPVIFLDEPTAGMDPKSRRFLWKRITEVVKSGDYNTGSSDRCVVLTSHSMEECEALCTRLAIMVNGRFMCIGTPQHLKNKYGKGYTVTVRVGGESLNIGRVLEFLLNVFPGASLKEKHHNMIVLQLPLAIVKLAEVFHTLETNKSLLKIEDYSVSQTTLDEVFVSFAKHQTDGTEQVPRVAQVVNGELEMLQVTSRSEVVI